MKKGFLKLSALFAALFIGVAGANAAVQVPDDYESCVLNPAAAEGEYNMTCNLKLQVTADGSVDSRVTIAQNSEYEIIFKLKPNKSTFNITNNEVKITAAAGWTVDGEASKVVNIKEDGSVSVIMKYTGDTELGPETYVFATAEYKKDDTAAEDCGFAYGTPIPDLVCKIVPVGNINYYYGSDGIYLGTDEEAENAYYKDCFACTTPDESLDGKYRDKDGKVTDEAGYKKACVGTCRQEKGEDNKWHYYDYENNEITAEEFKNICQENPKSGSFIPYVGIIAGVALIATATIMVRKQTKIRKI